MKPPELFVVMSMNGGISVYGGTKSKFNFCSAEHLILIFIR